MPTFLHSIAIVLMFGNLILLLAMATTVVAYGDGADEQQQQQRQQQGDGANVASVAGKNAVKNPTNKNHMFMHTSLVKKFSSIFRAKKRTNNNNNKAAAYAPAALSPPLKSSFTPVASKFGRFQGQDVLECQLQSDTGVTVKVMNYGAAIHDWQVPMPDGSRRSVVLGFDTFAHYQQHSPFFGAIVGRVANRIGGARFTLDGKEYTLLANEGNNQLHGGPHTFGMRLWQMRPLAVNSVQLELDSPAGEGGYPGRLHATVVYKLVGNRLSIEMEAETDAPTPVNFVQHNYFNLAGNNGDGDDGDDVRDHWLQLNANSFTPTDANQIPTGQIQSVDGTELDFRIGRPLKDLLRDVPIFLDHNFVLTNGNADENEQQPAAVLRAPEASLELRLWTNQPGMQVYTSKHLALPPNVPGLHGTKYPPFGGVCLEDQNFPDAINHQPAFPSPVLRPGQRYRHWCQIEIGMPSTKSTTPNVENSN